MLKNLNWSILQIYTSSTTHGITRTVLTCDTERARSNVVFPQRTALLHLTQRSFAQHSALLLNTALLHTAQQFCEVLQECNVLTDLSELKVHSAESAKLSQIEC